MVKPIMKIRLRIFLLVCFLPLIASAQPFTDVTTQVGLTGLSGGNGAAWGDFNNDGWNDLFVARFGDNQLFQNDGGTFSDVTDAFGMGSGQFASKSATWADFDSDGDLDMLVVNNSGQTRLLLNRRNAPFEDVTTASGLVHTGFGGRAVSDADGDGDPDIFLPTATGNLLYRNNGDLTFFDVSNSAGIDDIALGLGASFSDIDGDLRPELYFGTLLPNPARLYDNQGNLNFVDATTAANLTSTQSDWACAWANAANTGNPMLYVARDGANSLYQQQSDGSFVDIAATAGVAHPGNSQGVAWGDFNRDGWLDMYVINNGGDNALYQNNGNDTFTDVAPTHGLTGNGNTRDATWVDADNDGDLDLFLINSDGYQLWRNGLAQRNWLHVRLTGTASSAEALGARVEIQTASGSQTREVGSDNGIYGQHSPTVEFGLATNDPVTSLVVRWLNGEVQTFTNIAVNQTIHIVQGHPNLWIAREVVDFGEQDLGTPQSMALTIQNPGGDFGGDALTVSNIVSTSDEFVVSGADLPQTIAPNGEFSFDLTFTPADTGQVTGELVIQSNDPQGDFRLDVFGTGVAAYIAVAQPSVNFGGSPIDQPVQRPLTVHNQGNKVLTLTNLEFDQADFSTNIDLPFTIDPYDSETLTLVFTPSDTGQATGTLTIENDDFNGLTPEIELQGDGQAPIVALTANLNFGLVRLDSLASRILTITNTGQIPLIVYDVDIAEPAFSSDFMGVMTIAGGSSDRVQIYFQPDDLGEFNGIATIQTNAYNGTQTTTLTGIGAAPQIETVAEIQAPDTALDASSSTTFSIANNGLLPLHIGSIVSGDAAFQTDFEMPLTIPVDGQVDGQLIFQPQQEGSVNSNLFIFSDDPLHNPRIIDLSGVGLAAHAAASPLLLDFGDVRIDATAFPIMAIHIENTGQADLSFGALTINSPVFSLDSPAWPPGDLPPGADITLGVACQPTAVGDVTGSLIVETNDPDQSTVAIQLRARGISAALASDPTTLDFGQVLVGLDSLQTVLLRNEGTAVLTLQQIELTDATHFHIEDIPSLPLTLAPNATTEVSIQFQPTAEGDLSTEISVEVTGAAMSSLNVPVVGHGLRDEQAPFIDMAEISTAVAGLPVSIQTTITDNVAISDVNCGYRPGGQANFTVLPMQPLDAQNPHRYGVHIPASDVTARGLEFYLEATDVTGNRTIVPDSENPQMLPVQVPNLARSAAQPAEAYRLFSIPLVLDDNRPDFVLSNELGLYDPTQWRLWRWDSNEFLYQEYLIEPDNDFALTPGQAYWLITREARTLDTQPAVGTSAPTDQPFELTLQRDWNMIGTPFAFPVRWSNVSLPSGVENALWLWDGDGYEMADRLTPWEGYFVKNNNNQPVTLAIPPVALSGAEPLSRQQLTGGIQLMLQTEAGSDRDNFVAFGESDHRISEPPAAPEDGVQLYFVEDDAKWAVLTTTASGEGDHFSVEVRHNLSDATPLTLSLETGVDLPVGWDYQLIDETFQTPVGGSDYTFNAVPNTPYPFTLLVGTPEFLATTTSGLPPPPNTITLAPNYPNPFSEQTTIRFFLPVTTEVSTRVYSITGQLVRTLSDTRTFQAGHHQLYWDGRNDDEQAVASGVYILTLQAGDVQHKQQVLLVR